MKRKKHIQLTRVRNSFFLLSLEINKIEEFENVFIYLRVDKWSP